jgi:hypothetical protein
VVSSLSDQVEGRVVRANRVSRRSRQIIFAAIADLERHQRWLDRHRAAWAEDITRHHRLLKRKLVIGAFTRFTVEPILFVPVALARLLKLMLKAKFHASPALSFAETAIDTAKHPHQVRIPGLDGQLCTMERARALQAEPRGERSPIPNGVAFRAIASLKGPSRVSISALGVIAVLLIATGAVRATIASLPAEIPTSITHEVSEPTQQAAVLSAAALKGSVKAQRSAPAPGFAVLGATFASEPLQLPPQTVANMVLITSPLAAAVSEPSTEHDGASVAKELLAAEPRMKPKPKRKVARHEPEQQLPWWQQFPWIRIR